MYDYRDVADRGYEVAARRYNDILKRHRDREERRVVERERERTV